MLKITTKVAIVTLFIVTLLDIVTAWMVKIKQPFFNESNPIYLITGSFFLAILFKIFVVGLIILFFLKFYPTVFIHFRFLSVIYLVMVIIGQFTGIQSNLSAYFIEPSKVVEVPKEVRTTYYKETYKYTPKVPVTYSILFLLFIFTNWWQIEKEHLDYTNLNLKELKLLKSL